MSKRKQVHVPMEKIKEQEQYIESMREYTNRYYAIHGHKPRVLTETYGCPLV